MNNNLFFEIKSILSANKKTLCTVESCTGGLISNSFVLIPGSSSFFEGGIVSYSDNAKSNILGIDINYLKNGTAVNTVVSKTMLLRGIELFNADYGISTTGYAGPTGGTEQFPLGTVIISYGSLENNSTEIFHFAGTRENVIEKASSMSIKLLYEHIKKENPF